MFPQRFTVSAKLNGYTSKYFLEHKDAPHCIINYPKCGKFGEE
jgi:hypothetical protein